MFEADIHLRPLQTSILDIYKVFELLVRCLKGIWLPLYTVTPVAKIGFHKQKKGSDMELAQISKYVLKLTYSNLRLYIPDCTQGNTKPKHYQGTNTDTG